MIFRCTFNIVQYVLNVIGKYYRSKNVGVHQILDDNNIAYSYIGKNQ